MIEKHMFLICCALILPGCNGVGVLLNPPTETGYYPQTENQTVGKTPTDSPQKGTREVIRKTPD